MSNSEVKKVRCRRGFSLVELMVVLVIIGLLGTLVGSNVMSFLAKAKVKTAQAQIKLFHEAVNAYYLDIGEYPSDLLDLVEEPPGVEGWNPDGYLADTDVLPRDPWRNEYYYDYPGSRDKPKFDIYSYGPDGQEGGDDDIYNGTVEESEEVL
ncbi:MAG: type II secretion system major pseudopilin GspG [Sedimentisphaerales bacterium]|nr:type II secretion system major pseudopilin GspG [Sedimentisphaerales bacterium]